MSFLQKVEHFMGRTYLDRHTWIDREELAYVALKRSPRRGMVICADGNLRKARLGVSDMIFSIPAIVKILSKSVHGYVGVRELGMDRVFYFTATGANKNIF